MSDAKDSAEYEATNPADGLPEGQPQVVLDAETHSEPEGSAELVVVDPPVPPAPAAKPEGESWIETVKTVVYALLIALVIRTFFFQPFNIPSASMEGTLLIGDYLFVEKFAYG